jgi:hypothetical protein
VDASGLRRLAWPLNPTEWAADTRDGEIRNQQVAGSRTDPMLRCTVLRRAARTPQTVAARLIGKGRTSALGSNPPASIRRSSLLRISRTRRSQVNGSRHRNRRLAPLRSSARAIYLLRAIHHRSSQRSNPAVPFRAGACVALRAPRNLTERRSRIVKALQNLPLVPISTEVTT